MDRWTENLIGMRDFHGKTKALYGDIPWECDGMGYNQWYLPETIPSRHYGVS